MAQQLSQILVGKAAQLGCGRQGAINGPGPKIWASATVAIILVRIRTVPTAAAVISHWWAARSDRQERRLIRRSSAWRTVQRVPHVAGPK